MSGPYSEEGYKLMAAAFNQMPSQKKNSAKPLPFVGCWKGQWQFDRYHKIEGSREHNTNVHIFSAADNREGDTNVCLFLSV
jgi:hypothetical protein